MNQPNPADNPEAPPAVSVKRKRGRPRKDQSLKCVETAPVPPGFVRENGNQPRQVGPIYDANGGLVGQAVTGVVEAAFDAGYLLNVRVGNSNICLRGVVFNPGHYIPVTAENDVAPHIQMIRRSEIHLPTKNKNRRRRKRIEQNGSLPANKIHRLASITANLVPSKRIYTVPPVGAGGTVLPVVLQPVNFSNVSLPANQVTLDAYEAAHMTATRGKHVQTVAPLAVLHPYALIPTTQAMATATEALHSLPRTSLQVTPKGVQNANGPLNQVKPELLQGEEASSLKSADMIMPGDVNKGVSQSSEMHVENSQVAPKLSAADVGSEKAIRGVNEHLVIEPLQAVCSDHNLPASISKRLEDKRPGRMMELLQALQENMMENQAP